MLGAFKRFAHLGDVSELNDVGGLPAAPLGFAYLLGADGAYLLGADGAYLLGLA